MTVKLFTEMNATYEFLDPAFPHRPKVNIWFEKDRGWSASVEVVVHDAASSEGAMQQLPDVLKLLARLLKEPKL